MSNTNGGELWQVGGWLFTWQGGRLADVAHESNVTRAVDCLQVGEYDGVTGEASGSVADFRAACAEWVAACGADVFGAVVPRG